MVYVCVYAPLYLMAHGHRFRRTHVGQVVTYLSRGGAKRYRIVIITAPFSRIYYMVILPY